MDSNYIINLIKYFAQFPSKAGILKLFTREVEKYAGYDDLKAYINTLPDASVFPELETLITSTDQKEISNHISNITDYFMMLEYGAIPSEPKQAGLFESHGHFAFIIGRKRPSGNLGLMEEALEMDKIFTMVRAIANQMISDSKDNCELLNKFNQSSINISPIEPAALSDCIGWWCSFEKVSNTMLG